MTHLVASILLFGQTFHVRRTPSLSSNSWMYVDAMAPALQQSPALPPVSAHPAPCSGYPSVWAPVRLTAKWPIKRCERREWTACNVDRFWPPSSESPVPRCHSNVCKLFPQQDVLEWEGDRTEGLVKGSPVQVGSQAYRGALPVEH